MVQNLKEFHDTQCLNCGATLGGNYCSNCGQRATDVNLSLRTLLVEFVESLFSLEFGFWQTFKRLVFYPGSLTEEYIVGRRKRYSSPIRLYLLTSILFFFVISFSGGQSVQFSTGDAEDGGVELTGAEAILEMQSQLVEATEDTSKVESDSFFQNSFEGIKRSEKTQRFLEDPEAAKNRFLSYAPRAMFLMVPLVALLYKILYFRHHKPYLHFLVFALHLHALFYLVLSVSELLSLIQPKGLGEGLAVLVFLSFPVTAIRAQRRVFGDNWIKAIFKSGLVWHVYGFFLALVIVGVAALTVYRS